MRCDLDRRSVSLGVGFEFKDTLPSWGSGLSFLRWLPGPHCAITDSFPSGAINLQKLSLLEADLAVVFDHGDKK